jgi:UDP-glucose 4-epimerase
VSVLVLGASGFIGRHLVRDLVRAGRSVVAVDYRFPPFVAGPFAGVQQVQGDLFEFDEQALRALTAGADVIYHLAWSSIPATADAAPEADLNRNVGLMIRLLNSMEANGGRLVFASSGGTVYGRGTGEPHRESDPLCPISAYGVAKVAAELYARVYRETRGLDVRVARLSNPFGTGQLGGQLGAVSRFTIEALAGRPLEIWGTGDVVRDYLHIADAIAGLRRLGDVPADRLRGEAVFNIGSGLGSSLNDIVAILSDLLGYPVAVDHRPARGFDVPHNVLAIDAAKRHLDWSPRFSLHDGIRMMLDELRRSPDAAFSDPRGA